jgi:hypothetical protein
MSPAPSLGVQTCFSINDKSQIPQTASLPPSTAPSVLLVSTRGGWDYRREPRRWPLLRSVLSFVAAHPTPARCSHACPAPSSCRLGLGTPGWKEGSWEGEGGWMPWSRGHSPSWKGHRPVCLAAGFRPFPREPHKLRPWQAKFNGGGQSWTSAMSPGWASPPQQLGAGMEPGVSLSVSLCPQRLGKWLCILTGLATGDHVPVHLFQRLLGLTPEFCLSLETRPRCHLVLCISCWTLAS